MNYTDNTGMVMPVGPMGGYGSSNGIFGDGSIWIIILFLFMFNGWGGNGFGGNMGGMLYPWMNQMESTQAGFNQAAVTDALAGIQTSLTTGFSNAEVSRCNAAMDAMQTAYANQIASLERSYAAQTANTAAQTALSSQLASCCCENRLATANLSADLAREACADRAAVSSALRDVLEANNASTQRILDQMCQDKIDAKNEKIVELQQQLTMANLAASQNAQTAAIVANNEAQTTALERYLAPVPVPAYVVANPNGCSNYSYGCTCGVA